MQSPAGAVQLRLSGLTMPPHTLSLPLQLFGVSSLHVQRAGLDAAIGNVDPSTADMASRTRWHPNHVLSLFLPCACLRLELLQIKIQLRRLARLGLRIGNGRLHGAIHG